jgi:PilZ domain-containing protein
MTAQASSLKETQELTNEDFCPPNARRVFPRRAAKWPVTVKTTKGKTLAGKTINVSREGLLISLNSSPKLGDKLFIDTIVFHKGNHLNLQGVAIVKHNSIQGSHFNIGLQFTVATELTTKFLDKYASNEI